MSLAYTMMDTPGDLDHVLLSLADSLASEGWKTAGVVQINSDREDCDRCDMDVKVLPDGPAIRISQSLGKDSKGCRLNPEALETAVAAVADSLNGDVDVLIINKFGKHEAAGRGFRDVIAQALAREIPGIVGLNGMNQSAFMDFSDGLAVKVEGRVEALKAWVSESKS